MDVYPPQDEFFTNDSIEEEAAVVQESQMPKSQPPQIPTITVEPIKPAQPMRKKPAPKRRGGKRKGRALTLEQRIENIVAQREEAKSKRKAKYSKNRNVPSESETDSSSSDSDSSNSSSDESVVCEKESKQRSKRRTSKKVKEPELKLSLEQWGKLAQTIASVKHN